jgi:hypothetical protein
VLSFAFGSLRSLYPAGFAAFFLLNMPQGQVGRHIKAAGIVVFLLLFHVPFLLTARLHLSQSEGLDAFVYTGAALRETAPDSSGWQKPPGRLL